MASRPKLQKRPKPPIAILAGVLLLSLTRIVVRHINKPLFLNMGVFLVLVGIQATFGGERPHIYKHGFLHLGLT